MDQQLAKIAIASLGNPGQTRLAACRDLPGHKAEPSSKVASASEGLAFADRRGESRRVQHADAGDSRQTPGCLIGLRARCELIIEGGDASIENSPFFYFDRIQTPLLIVQGSRDTAVAPFLGDQIFVALRRLGKEAEYAMYDGEGHSPSQGWSYKHQVDLSYRIIRWLDDHLR